MENMPEFRPGDVVKVYAKIKEGDKERIAPFQGVVIQMKGREIGRTFTVRKISAGIGVERIFPLHSPLITKIEIKKKGKVRRAKLNYLKKLRGKKIKIKEGIRKTEAADQKPVGSEEQLEKSAPDEPAEVHKETEKKVTRKAREEKKSEEHKDEGAPGHKTVDKA